MSKLSAMAICLTLTVSCGGGGNSKSDDSPSPPPPPAELSLAEIEAQLPPYDLLVDDPRLKQKLVFGADFRGCTDTIEIWVSTWGQSKASTIESKTRLGFPAPTDEELASTAKLHLTYDCFFVISDRQCREEGYIKTYVPMLTITDGDGTTLDVVPTDDEYHVGRIGYSDHDAELQCTVNGKKLNLNTFTTSWNWGGKKAELKWKLQD